MSDGRCDPDRPTLPPHPVTRAGSGPQEIAWPSPARPASERAALAAGTLVLAFAGPAAAKEITSGGGTGGATTGCAPVTSLKYKGDATTSDTALATVSVDYATKACDKDPVVVRVEMWQSTNPSNVLWLDENAPMSGRFTVAVTARVSYQVKVTVTDATTGATEGSQTIFAGAVPKGV